MDDVDDSPPADVPSEGHARLLYRFYVAHVTETTDGLFVIAEAHDPAQIVVLVQEGGADDDAYADGGFGAVPASGEAIAALPETTVGEVREKDCAVCLEGFEEGDKLRKLPCSHGFHESCIFEWLRVSRICPHCRFALPADKSVPERKRRRVGE